MVLWGSGRPRRQLLHLDDLARAVRFLLEQEVKAGDFAEGLLNVRTGEDISISDLAAWCRG